MANPKATFTEGRITYTVNGENLETYYKLFGSLTADASRRPLIALHGGPGMSHDYLLPISDLSLPGPHSRPVLLYDQIGNGRSTRLKDKPKEYFTIQLFVNELANLISHFKITHYDVLGHSWGGMLAAEFELGLQPSGLKSLIISDSLTEMRLWRKSIAQLLEPFGDDVKEGIAARYVDPLKCRAALEKFQAVYGCRIQPVPQEIVYSVLDLMLGDKETGKGGDSTVSANMYVPPSMTSVFAYKYTPRFGGVLKDWSIADRLHHIRVPVFLINGRFDMAQDFVCEEYFWKVKKIKWVTFQDSCHVPMWEERDRYMKIVSEWIEQVE